MNKIYKSILSVAAVAIVMGATMTPAAVNAWGDSANGRHTYTTAEINNGALGNSITFNSITNGKIGDERSFVGAKLSSDQNNLWNAETLSVKDGETYTIRLYVHNNSPQGYNNVAQGVTTKISLPTAVGKEQTVTGYITASNAAPNTYWDEVRFTSSEDFYLEYVSGSAKWTNGKLGTVALSDSVITSEGVLVGYDALDGKIPGCYDYDGQVTIQVKVHSSMTSKISKVVRLKGTSTWSEEVDAKIGDEVEFQIEYVNFASSVANNVMIRDLLPTNMEYVAGSTYLYNAAYQNGTKIDNETVTTTGINIGSYSTDGNAYVRFTAKVVDKTMVCGTNQLVNWASSTVGSTVYKDDASVFVKKTEGCDSKKDDDNKQTPVQDNNGGTITRIANTGPAEVAGAALGAGSLVTAAGYFVSSKMRK